MTKSVTKSCLIFLYVTYSLGLSGPRCQSRTTKQKLLLRMTIIGSSGGFPITCIVFRVYKGLHFCKPGESMQVQIFRLQLKVQDESQIIIYNMFFSVSKIILLFNVSIELFFSLEFSLIC